MSLLSVAEHCEQEEWLSLEAQPTSETSAKPERQERSNHEIRMYFVFIFRFTICPRLITAYGVNTLSTIECTLWLINPTVLHALNHAFFLFIPHRGYSNGI